MAESGMPKKDFVCSFADCGRTYSSRSHMLRHEKARKPAMLGEIAVWKKKTGTGHWMYIRCTTCRPNDLCRISRSSCASLSNVKYESGVCADCGL